MGRNPPPIEAFESQSTRKLEDWRSLWEEDRTFPVRSHRRGLGGLLVRIKGWLRPLVRSPQADLWERQRVFNLVLLSHLEELSTLLAFREDIVRDLAEVRSDLMADVKQHHRRISHLEEFKRVGLGNVTEHTDALFARIDHKLDRYRRESRELWAKLGGLLEQVERGEAGAEERSALLESKRELAYAGFEDRHRGTEAEIAERLAIYVERLRQAPGPILDLGCGRGESLAVFREAGLEARGVDSSAEMVRRCRERGLDAEKKDLLAALAEAEPESLGAVVSFHVIEHLPASDLDRLVGLARAALKPGGILLLETPNPLSVMVAARSFWLDPTHQIPVHPDRLRHLVEEAGLDDFELIELRRFPAEERLPEVETSDLSPELQGLATQIHGLRDRLDGLLFGAQDYAVLARRPS